MFTTALRAMAKRSRLALLPSDARAVLRDRLTYLPPAKLSRLMKALDRAFDLDGGDYLEFGVALGGSSILIAKHATADRQFHGFDVFGLIPPPESEKDDAKSKERYRVIASGQSKGLGGDTYYGYRSDLYDDVRAAFARYGRPVDDRQIFLHKGLFEETWPSYRRKEIAFAHIDCDWYDPVRFCLNAVMPRLVPGAVIVLDDYHDYGGCRTATEEFLQENPGRFELDDGANLVLSRKRDR